MTSRTPMSSFERAMFARALGKSRDMVAGRWMPASPGAEKIDAVALTISELGLLPTEATGHLEALGLADAVIHALNCRGYDVVATGVED